MSSIVNALKPSDLKTLISDRYKASMTRPLLIEGSPGLGKTQIPAQAAAELGVAFKVIHAPLMQPEDYGFPVISADRRDVEFIVSREKFPLEGSDCPDKGIFLVDELSQADNSAQKILANLVHEREIHGKRLKPGWAIVATGNRTGDRAGANRILSHLGNRVTRIQLEASIDDWTQWALTNDVQTEVIAFIRFRPNLLSAFDSKNDINATPRAWVDGVSRALGSVKPAHEFAVFAGDVGEGPAAEFCGFLKVYRKLPNPDTVLLNPKTEPVPTDAATQYAIVGALAARTTAVNFGRALTYIERLKTPDGTPASEFSVLYVRDVMRRAPEIQNSKDFTTWATGPGAKLLT